MRLRSLENSYSMSTSKKMFLWLCVSLIIFQIVISIADSRKNTFTLTKCTSYGDGTGYCENDDKNCFYVFKKNIVTRIYCEEKK